MICLTLYLHPVEENVVIDALRSCTEVTGFTIMRCEGHGSGDSVDVSGTAADQVVGFVPRMRVEVILGSESLDPVLSSVQSSLSPTSRGHFAVTPVLRSGPLRSS